MAKGKPFAPELRQEAVRLHRVSGKPFRAVAEDLGVAGVVAALGHAGRDRRGQEAWSDE